MEYTVVSKQYQFQSRIFLDHGAENPYSMLLGSQAVYLLIVYD